MADTATLIIEHLKKNFKPRCIQKGESLEDAHRYAGQVELAQALIRKFGKEDEES